MEHDNSTAVRRFVTPVTTSPAGDSPLRELAFLVGGTWVGNSGEDPTLVYTETFGWTLNGHFIASRQTSAATDSSSAGIKSGLAGVDSRTGKLVQWIFMSDGGCAVLVGKDDSPANVWVSVGELTSGGSTTRIRSILTKIDTNRLSSSLAVWSGDGWVESSELVLVRTPPV